MVTEADWKTWRQDEFTPYMDAVIDAFGINRVMFGSDWPVCLVAASYEEVVSIAEDYFSTYLQDEQEKVFAAGFTVIRKNPLFFTNICFGVSLYVLFELL